MPTVLLHFQGRIDVNHKAEDSDQLLTSFPIVSHKSEVILRAGSRLARCFSISTGFCMVSLGPLDIISAPDLRKVKA